MSSGAPFRVAITGGIGSGKTTVADRFGQLGAGLIDSDRIAHQLTQPDGAAIPELVEAFGRAMLDDQGGLDRARMRALVFERPDQRQRLESILHPMIRSASEQSAARLAVDHPYLMFVIPLLAESARPRERFDRILVVDCDPSVQLARVMARNGMTESQVRAIMAAQAGRAERLAIADDVIDNSTDIDALAAPIARLHAQYLEQSTKPLRPAV